MKALESIVHASLSSFAAQVLLTPWYGKEREAVSYYAFGFLAQACAPGKVGGRSAEV